MTKKETEEVAEVILDLCSGLTSGTWGFLDMANVIRKLAYSSKSIIPELEVIASYEEWCILKDCGVSPSKDIKDDSSTFS